MKQPERVAELLAELRALAETDFERHRIDVLERDLTAPPTVEVIDDKHQKFDGVIYLKDKGGHYSTNSFIHRAVFAYYNGEISTGKAYNVHHVDRNKDNNCVGNLQLLTITEHAHIPKKNPTEKTCAYCGATFYVTGKNRRQKCCSTSCAHKLRIKPAVEKKCAFCGKTFTANKDHCNRQTCCSLSCAAKLGAEKRRKPQDEKICPTCGEKFYSKKSGQVFCSRSCYMKSRHANEPAPPTIEKICPTCGKKFSPACRDKRTVYCSISCARKMAHKKKSNKATMILRPKSLFLLVDAQIFAFFVCEQSSVIEFSHCPIYQV